MGTGYTRNDTSNNIADGNIINAADLDGEFDAIESAMGTGGHTHDGTSAEGGPVTVLGPVQDFVASATEIKPKTTNTLSIGTNSLLFKDMFLDGVATIGSIKIDNAGTIGSASDADAIAISSGGVVTFSQAVSNLGNVTGKTGSGFVLALQTSDTTIEATNVLGKIEFSAPDEASGTDAILVGASIEALAEGTFSSSVNSTALVFKTNTTGAATERMRLTSAGDLHFLDSRKAIFGAGSDLQIYHDGANSYIQDTGTGALGLFGSTFVGLYETGSGDKMVIANGGSDVELYYDNALKLATTSTGIDVTGTVTADNGSSTTVLNGNSLIFDRNSANYIRTSDASGYLRLQTGSGDTAFFASNGDISFYEDTGTTAKFFWDADAESLGIGTTSPSAQFTSYKSLNGDPQLGHFYNDNSGAAAEAVIYITNSSTLADGLFLQTYGANGTTAGGFVQDASIIGSGTGASGGLSIMTRAAADMRFYTNGHTNERMRISSAGNVGIGVVPEAWGSAFPSVLQIGAAASLTTSGGDNARLLGNVWYDGTNYKRITSGFAHQYEQTGGTHRWSYAATGAADSTISFSEAMRIDASGNLLVGTISSTGGGRLELKGSGTGAYVPTGYNGNNVNSVRIVSGGSPSTSDTVGISMGIGGGAEGYFGIVQDSSGYANFVFNSYNGSYAERMRIDSSGNVGIGIDSPTAPLHVQVAGSGEIARFRDNGSNAVVDVSIVNDSQTWALRVDGASSDSFHIRNSQNSTNPVTIDTSGNVGIGDSDPQRKLHISGDRDAILRFENTRTVESGDQILGSLEFYSNDESGTGANVRSRINALTSTGGNSSYLTFSTADGTTDDVEAMRIDSSGNLIVGDTSAGGVTSGGKFYATPLSGIYAAANADNAGYFNRNGGDGSIVEFRAGNAPVGRIGVSSDRIYLSGANEGIFIDDSLNYVGPSSASGGFNDNHIDLGIATNRFKDLYLSGGVYLGGTGAANKLDDYEEGTWTPVVYDTSTSGHVLTLNSIIGKYKKIGNWVNCTLQVGRNDATSLSGVITITNLPFTVAAQGSATGGTFWLDRTSTDRIGVVYVVPSADRFYLLSDHAVDDYLLMSEWQNGRPIYIQVSYNSA